MLFRLCVTIIEEYIWFNSVSLFTIIVVGQSQQGIPDGDYGRGGLCGGFIISEQFKRERWTAFWTVVRYYFQVLSIQQIWTCARECLVVFRTHFIEDSANNLSVSCTSNKGELFKNVPV
jgi:hypothetical protein